MLSKIHDAVDRCWELSCRDILKNMTKIHNKRVFDRTNPDPAVFFIPNLQPVVLEGAQQSEKRRVKVLRRGNRNIRVGEGRNFSFWRVVEKAESAD